MIINNNLFPNVFKGFININIFKYYIYHILRRITSLLNIIKSN